MMDAMATTWRDLEEAVSMDVRSAANCGETRVLEEAGERGADVSGGGGGWTALMYACSRQSSAAVDVLLRLGADVDARDRRGQTALMQASKLGDVDVVRKLLEAGADPTPRDREGRSALSLAAAWGQSRTLRLLLLDPVEDLRGLLASLGLAKYGPAFAAKGVDLRAFLAMSEEDLRDVVGITLVGPRRKMSLAIAKWRHLIL